MVTYAGIDDDWNGHSVIIMTEKCRERPEVKEKLVKLDAIVHTGKNCGNLATVASLYGIFSADVLLVTEE